MSIKPADYPLWLRVVIVINLIMLIVNILFFSGPLSYIALSSTWGFKDFASWIGTLVSTFLGAFFAFKFGIHSREAERINSQVTAGNAALSALFEMWDRLTQYQQEVVAPFRKRDDAWLNMPVGSPLGDAHVDRASLSFLLQGDPQIWQQVALEDRRYQLVRDLTHQREKLILQETWPKLSEAKFGIGASMPERHVHEILGVGLVQRLKKNAEAVIALVDEDVVSTMATINALGRALRQRFPGRKFITVIPNQGTSQPSQNDKGLA